MEILREAGRSCSIKNVSKKSSRWTQHGYFSQQPKKIGQEMNDSSSSHLSHNNIAVHHLSVKALGGNPQDNKRKQNETKPPP